MDPDAAPDFYLMRIRIRVFFNADSDLGYQNDADPCGGSITTHTPLEDDVVGLREQLHQVVNLGDVHAGVDPVELELAPQHPPYLLALQQSQS